MLGVRRDGQKLLLAAKNMGGNSEDAWRIVLDDLIARGLRTPELLLIDGGADLKRALASLWPDVPTQRCTFTSTETCSPFLRGHARGVQAPDQDPDRPAISRNRRNAVLVVTRIRQNHPAQGRRVADPPRATRLNAS